MAYEIHTENLSLRTLKIMPRNLNEIVCQWISASVYVLTSYMCAERTTCFFYLLCIYFLSISVTLLLVILWRTSLLSTLLRLAEIWTSDFSLQQTGVLYCIGAVCRLDWYRGVTTVVIGLLEVIWVGHADSLNDNSSELVLADLEQPRMCRAWVRVRGEKG